MLENLADERRKLDIGDHPEFAVAMRAGLFSGPDLESEMSGILTFKLDRLFISGQRR